MRLMSSVIPMFLPAFSHYTCKKDGRALVIKSHALMHECQSMGKVTYDFISQAPCTSLYNVEKLGGAWGWG